MKEGPAECLTQVVMNVDHRELRVIDLALCDTQARPRYVVAQEHFRRLDGWLSHKRTLKSESLECLILSTNERKCQHNLPW
jgi:hypothetical protein